MSGNFAAQIGKQTGQHAIRHKPSNNDACGKMQGVLVAPCGPRSAEVFNRGLEWRHYQKPSIINGALNRRRKTRRLAACLASLNATRPLTTVPNSGRRPATQTVTKYTPPPA